MTTELATTTKTVHKRFKVRDAIIVSGWYWENCNVPERLALALAYRGGECCIATIQSPFYGTMLAI